MEAFKMSPEEKIKNYFNKNEKGVKFERKTRFCHPYGSCGLTYP